MKAGLGWTTFGRVAMVAGTVLGAATVGLLGVAAPIGVAGASNSPERIYVANVLNGQVGTFQPTANGNVAPSPSLTSPSSSQYGEAFDSAGDLWISSFAS